MKRHNCSKVFRYIYLGTSFSLLPFNSFAQGINKISELKTSQLSEKYSFKAYGGGLSSGFKNNLLTKEGQLESFPNLISKQLNTKFIQPLVSEDYSRNTTQTNKPLQNQTSISRTVSSSNVVDNYAYPTFSKNMRGSISTSSNVYRLESINENTYNWLIKEPIPNFFTFEVGFDDLLQAIINNGSGIGGIVLETIDQTDEVVLLAHLSKNGSKGLIATVPNILDLPYFQQINKSILPNQLRNLYKRSSTTTDPVPINLETDLILPTAELSKNTHSTPYILEDELVISKDPYDNEFLLYAPNDFNEFKIKRSAQRFNLAVVDLFTIYSTILKGEYITHDGIKISPEWPNGNFFSSDGIYPSTIGQRVIANEFIKAANLHYQLTIPLLSTLP